MQYWIVVSREKFDAQKFRGELGPNGRSRIRTGPSLRQRDQAAVKRDAQRIYLARNAAQARAAFQRFRFRWHVLYPA